ncbi:restriction endonuclease subunit S [Clostridium perfringens]|uniref:Restriction endonuclease subunit S n=1 Tax=Clostridium perfringens TaxID=1502 RepID=A0AAW9KH24_CLOPF|nr:restriction endonuclease subunit S [Clostridium perfringens]
MSFRNNDWHNYILNDFIKYSSEKIDIEKISEFNYISTENMLPNKGQIINASSLPKSKTVTKYSIGDTLISNIRPYFKKIWFANKIGGASNDVLVIKSDNALVDKKFLYYLLSEDSFFDYVMLTSKGTKMPRGDKGAILNYKASLPPLKEQKAIAKILSDLDEKIEVNNKINKNLEEMAQVIFKQWFVDFEFPNEEGKPYKSSGGEMVKSELGMIPKGWKVFYMEEFVNTYNGYSYKGKELTKSNDAMITIKNFDRKGGYKLDGLKEISISNKVKEHHYIDINDILIAHTDLTQGAEIIGNPIMVYSKGKYNKLIMSMDTVKVTSKKSNINNSLLYYIFKDFRFKSFALKFVNGTTVLHLSKTTIPKYKIALPNDENILLKIGGILNSLTNKISNNIIENERLEKLRDTLLPKLMSGEIRVCLENSEN